MRHQPPPLRSRRRLVLAGLLMLVLLAVLLPAAVAQAAPDPSSAGVLSFLCPNIDADAPVTVHGTNQRNEAATWTGHPR